MMMRFLRQLSMVALLTTTQLSNAQTNDFYTFRHIDTQNGLSQNTVTAITQDKQGFLWFATKDGLNRYDGVSFRVFRRGDSALPNNFVNALYLDDKDMLWVGTEHGVSIYHPETESLSLLDAKIGDSKRIIEGSIRAICQDTRGNILIAAFPEGLLRLDASQNRLDPAFPQIKGRAVSHISVNDGILWVGVAGDNLYFKDKSGSNLVPFVDDNGGEPFRYMDVNDIKVGGKDIYIATDHGLWRMNQTSHHTVMLQQGFFRTLNLSSDRQTLWAGSQDGLYLINLQSGSTTHIRQPETDVPFTISDNAIYSLFTDIEGNIWIGSYFGGINYQPAQQINFRNYYPRPERPFIGRRVREMCEDFKGRVWIGTEDKGLLCYNAENDSLQHVETHLLTNNIHGLATDGEELWVGAFDGGLELFNLKDGSHRTYFQNTNNSGLISNYIFSLYIDTKHTLWVGTPNGLMRYIRENDSFEKVEKIPSVFVYHILQTHDGVLWLATYVDGLYSYDPNTKKTHHYEYQNGQDNTIADSKVISLYEDSHHRLWVMTHDGGLSLLDRKTGAFKPWPLGENGQYHLVYKMVEDRQENLWCSTNNGLVCFKPDEGKTTFYTTAQGLQSDHFNYQSGLLDRSGYLYFGSINGFVRFHPSQIRVSSLKPQIALSALYIFNRLQQPGADGSPLKQSIDYCNNIKLKHNQNSFSIAPRILSFAWKGTLALRYRLDDFDHHWQYGYSSSASPLQKDSNGLMINYSNLPYGNYTLRIQAISTNGQECMAERLLYIRVMPPFYLTAWAKALYLIAFILTTYLLWRHLRRKQRRRLLYAQRQLEQQKRHELYASKISFFTSITHEIRTPLTLIKSPLETLLRRDNLDDDMAHKLHLIDINTEHLISLVNELLDFRRIEGKNMRLNLQTFDLSDFINTMIQVFSPSMEERKLQLKTNIEPGIYITADQDLMGKILTNLVNNALKYAVSFVDITLRRQTSDDRTEKTTILFETTNDGNIVPLSQREEIFKPFSRYTRPADNTTGTGLGLALVRSLTELHHGTIAMDKDTSVNRFVLELPVSQNSRQVISNTATFEETSENNSNLQIEPEADTNDKNDLVRNVPTRVLLFVEDNAQLRQFLADHFSTTYRILQAGNGHEAIQLLQQNNVSLIVSDVMMPEMDGIALLQYVKQNVDFSHIPVVLLTAKTTIQTRLDGLRNGADAYIDKPFDMSVLEQTIQTLLQNIQRLYDSFSQRPYSFTPSTAVSDIEVEFVKRLNKIVVENMENPEYDIDQLASAMNMSRSSLSRKIKSALDMTPNDYMRVERLKRSVVLLKTGRYRVAEVCYMVGFNTPSYFAKCFQKQYGMLPSDLVSE